MIKRKVWIEYRQLFEVEVEAETADRAKQLALDTDWMTAPVLGTDVNVYDVIEAQDHSPKDVL